MEILHNKIYKELENGKIKEYLMEAKTLAKKVKKGEEWIRRDDLFPDYVDFSFVYPNGKHGDIDMYIASNYGTVVQLDALTYKASLPTVFYEEISFLEGFYFAYKTIDLEWDYRTYDFNDPLEWHRQGFSTVFYNFGGIKKYNNYLRLREIIRAMQFYPECIKSQEYKYAYKISGNFHDQARKKSADTYKLLIKSNKTTRKWISEQQLFALTMDYFPDAIYQYRAEWLGKQSLDVFIPERNIGIEYQGKQHYEPVDFFGGLESFKHVQQLDLRKKEICKEQEIQLIYWKYDIPINKINFERMVLSAEEDSNRV